jgi:GTP-binding protein Era
MHAESRCGYVAIVGRPNVGKSTLLNALVGQKVSIVSDKPHTTRHRLLGVLNHAQGQALFLDTPGLGIGRKGALHKLMSRAIQQSLQDADVILLVVDARRFDGDDAVVSELVAGRERDTILVLNKIDRLKSKADLLPVLTRVAERFDFAALVPVGARAGDNLAGLVREVMERLPEGPRLYPDDTVTDRDLRFRIGEIIREKLMGMLHEEVPYGLTVEIQSLTQNAEGQWQVSALIWLERDSHKAIVIGKGGSVLKAAGRAARLEIADLLGARVHLETWVKLRQNWSDNEQELKRLGFDIL